MRRTISSTRAVCAYPGVKYWRRRSRRRRALPTYMTCARPSRNRYTPGSSGTARRRCLVAVITGYMARNQIKQTGEQGMGMATAGMIIGIVHLVLIALGVIALVLIVIFGVGIAFLGIAARH